MAKIHAHCHFSPYPSVSTSSIAIWLLSILYPICCSSSYLIKSMPAFEIERKKPAQLFCCCSCFLPLPYALLRCNGSCDASAVYVCVRARAHKMSAQIQIVLRWLCDIFCFFFIFLLFFLSFIVLFTCDFLSSFICFYSLPQPSSSPRTFQRGKSLSCVFAPLVYLYIYILYFIMNRCGWWREEMKSQTECFVVVVVGQKNFTNLFCFVCINVLQLFSMHSGWMHIGIHSWMTTTTPDRAGRLECTRHAQLWNTERVHWRNDRKETGIFWLGAVCWQQRLADDG